MFRIGLIREGKIPVDNRVALTPLQCKFIKEHYADISIEAQSSKIRCFADREYIAAGIPVVESLENCDVIMGIKEVPINMLLANKTYIFFSHTKKLQPHNQLMLQEIIKKKITLIDYECLEHPDGARILGFGFFAGIVGAHNGIMAYGKKTGAYHLERVNPKKDLRYLIHSYFGLKLPNIKIAVTGTGRVAHGILEVMNLLDIHEVEPEDFIANTFSYPVYVHLKGADLYQHKNSKAYNRKHFHEHPSEYISLFKAYVSHADIVMNGVYWEKDIPRLFETEDMRDKDFSIKTIADISDDYKGSIPCNMGSGTAEKPVYGVDLISLEITEPYLEYTLDIMAVANLPNELPRDASKYFGEQIIKEFIEGLLSGKSEEIHNATIILNGKLMPRYGYMKAYAEGE